MNSKFKIAEQKLVSALFPSIINKMKTLRINLPFGSVILQSITWLILFCLMIEAFARTTYVKNIHLYESYGTSHPQFDTQIMRVKSRLTQDGHIDCMLIGNSQVLTSVDPVIVQQIYFEKTGMTIHCQNFGMPGMTPLTAGPLSRILIRNFHPSIIIFGTGIFDYKFSIMEGSDMSIMTSPWVNYQLGTFSIDGWLIENSYSYRYYLGLNRYLLYYGTDTNTEIDTNGHKIYIGRKNMTQKERIDGIDIILSNLEITEKQVNGLRDLLSLNSDEVKIVVIEMLVDPVFFSKRAVRKIYPDFRDMLVYETTQAGAELWLTKDVIEIPENGWYDLVHLNQIGSSSFSTLFGNYLVSNTSQIIEKIP